MTTDPNIRAILEKALLEIRKQHGLAIEVISVQWVGVVEDPVRAVTHIEVQGRAAQ